MRFLIFTAALSLSSQAIAQDDFDDRVMEAILNNPEVILLAIQKLEAERERIENEAAQEQIAAVSDDLFKDDPNILLVEFFDYRCGYCAQSATTMQSLPNQLTNGVRLIEFPILGQASEEIAKVSLAVRNIEGQSAYLRFHYAVFDAAGRIGDTASALRLAEDLNLDVDAIEAEAKSNDVAAELLKNRRLAQTLGISGTPTFVGRDQIYGGLLNPEELVEILDTTEDKS